MPPRIPKFLQHGTLRVPVMELRDGRFAFSYYPTPGSARVVVKRSKIEGLRREFDAVATKILNAETAAQDLTADDRRMASVAITILAPLNLPLDQSARLLVEAAGLAGGPARILDACRIYGQNNHALTNTPSAEVVRLYLADVRSGGVTDYYADLLEDDLEKFAARFPAPLAQTPTLAMSEWLGTMPVGLRRRRKLRDQLVALFNFARQNNILPEALRTAAEKIKRPKVKRKAPTIYTPDQFSHILAEASRPIDREKHPHRKDVSDFVPALCIAGFAGLRWTEIIGDEDEGKPPLDWKHIHWQDAVIEVGEEHKTGYRLVPIQPNLAAWLAPWRGSEGPVCPFRNRQVVNRTIRRLSQRAEIPFVARQYANAFRHSFVTYRVAVTHDMPLISTESGHSVPELRKSYNRASLESIGKAWSAIIPDLPENITRMPRRAHR